MLRQPVPAGRGRRRQLGGRRINQAVWGALAQMAPERAFACPGGADSSIAFSGLDKGGEPWRGWVLTEGFNEIACGGRPDKDGMEGQGSNITNQANTPIELLELEYPIRIDEYGFVPDTEGPGCYRGGLAMSRTYTFLDDEIEVRVRSDRAKRPPGASRAAAARRPRGSAWRRVTRRTCSRASRRPSCAAATGFIPSGVAAAGMAPRSLARRSVFFATSSKKRSPCPCP